MGREVNVEKEFSENLDRMLAGEEVKVSADVDDDCRGAIDFAQKLVRLRGVPSPSFKAELKERLLSRLAEEEKKVRSAEVKHNRFWEALGHLIPRQPVWRAVTPIILVVMLAVGVLWGTGILPAGVQAPSLEIVPAPTKAPAPTPAPATPPPLELEATPSETTGYLPGEEVKIEFVFNNVGSESIAVSPFPPRIQIMRPRTDEVVRSFAEGSEQRDISPGKTVEYALVWDQKDDNGKEVAPGWYYVYVKDITISKDTVPIAQTSFGPITGLLIQFPQGAMEKAIEANESQTVNGVTMTLERVELSTSGVKVYVFTTPPGYSELERPTPEGPPLAPPPMMMHVTAEYSVDGGAIKQAGPSAIRFLENGIEHIWDWLDPVPKNATELTFTVFTVTKLGDLEGPWEFSILLEP